MLIYIDTYKVEIYYAFYTYILFNIYTYHYIYTYICQCIYTYDLIKCLLLLSSIAIEAKDAMLKQKQDNHTVANLMREQAEVIKEQKELEKEIEMLKNKEVVQKIAVRFIYKFNIYIHI